MNANFRSGYLVQGQALGGLPLYQPLSANNQVINVMGQNPISLVYLQSDSTDSSARVFTLVSSSIVGHQVTIVMTSGSSTTAQMKNTGNAALISDWVCTQNQSLTVQWNGTAWVEVCRNNQGAKVAGTLSQSDIVGMYATPVTLIPAPGAGRCVVVDEVELFHSYATAAYTGGEDILLQYNTTAANVITMDKTIVTATSSLASYARPTVYVSTSSDTGFSLTANANKAVEITNGTAAFSAGDAANVIKYRITYHVITLLV